MDIGEGRNARNDWIKKGRGRSEGREGGKSTIVTRQRGRGAKTKTKCDREKKGGNPEKQTYVFCCWVDG